MTLNETASSRTRATVLMSGGIDSAACAHFLLSQGIEVEGLFLDYGQAAATFEENAVIALARHLEIPMQRVAVGGAERFGAGELVGRNALLTFAALFLTRGRPGVIALGVHAGTPYYDCSQPFVSSVANLVAEHTDGRVVVLAPFIAWSKQDVFDYFNSMGLPLDLTYSCETGTLPTCGVCASCRDRKSLRS